MKSVGLRELKNRLSAYVRQVTTGETILVTDRGEVVAELNPPGRSAAPAGVPPGLLELARKGLVTLGKRNDPAVYRRLPRVPVRATSSELLDWVRGER